MQPSGSFLSPIDRVLDRYGYHAGAGVRRHASLWHRHRGIEIIFVHSGAVEAYSTTWQHVLHAGELTMSYAHIDHGSNGFFKRTVLHFVTDLVPIEMRGNVIRLLETNGCVHAPIGSESAARIIWASQQLTFMQKRSDSLASARALLGLVTAEVEASINQSRDLRYIRVLYAVIDYMRSNIDSEEKLEWLADRFNISARHLHHLFRAQLNCSPHQYWLSLKLDQACRLLKYGEPIQDIPALVGFQSMRGFQRAFQRAYRMTPSEYRAHTNPD